MPNLYTSLLARKLGTRTLAPKNDPPEVPEHVASRSSEEWASNIFETHKGVFAEMMSPGELGPGQPARPAPVRRSVGIIGAGLAGLSAAYELGSRGYSITILEASERIGGRTWANHNLVGPHTMDRGAELIGSNHPLWLNYERIFKIGFTKVLEYQNSPIILDDTPLKPDEEKQLFKEMEAALAFISAAAKAIFDPYRPWTDPQASNLDRENVYDFVMEREWSDRCKKAVLQQLEADNGVTAKKQSLLALISMVSGGGADRYWVDTEVYRSRRGTEALSTGFLSALQGMGAVIHCNSPVVGVEVGEQKIHLQMDGAMKSLDFDDVILTIPPSAWATVSRWKPSDLDSFMSSPPQMGKNTKCLLAFAERFWEQQDLAPSSTEPGPVDQTWETTEAYKSAQQFGMVAFAGADHAAKLSERSDADAIASTIASSRK
jgi:monoamine oxidase